MDKSYKIIDYSLENIDQVVDQLLPEIKKSSVITFTGGLGAGKTTIIKKILEKMGVTETVTSPTYTYVVSYKNNNGQIFHHFDLYRIKNLSELYDMGLNELLYQPNSRSFIEWPEAVEEIINKNRNNLEILMEYGQKEQKRTLKYRHEI